tara:strand:- start:5191 stop:5517 length:327 start_codon:yes stop_codon:yes gene_type:complete
MNRKQIKEDHKDLKTHRESLCDLHAALSVEAANFQSRNRITGDPEQAELSELYKEACDAAKVVVDFMAEDKRLSKLVEERRKRLPGLFRRLFPKKQRVRLVEPTEMAA